MEFLRFLLSYRSSGEHPPDIYRQVNTLTDEILHVIARRFHTNSGKTIYVNYSGQQVVVDRGSLLLGCPGKLVPQNINISFPSDTTTHSNILLIDNSAREIELFEPNGPNFETYNPLIKLLGTLSSYRISNFQETCNFPSGPQLVAGLPICAIFSLLYIYLRLSEPFLSRSLLVEYLTAFPRDQLILIADNFLHYEYYLAEYYSLFLLQDLKSQSYDILAILYEKWETEEDSLPDPSDSRRLEIRQLSCRAKKLATIVRESIDYYPAKIALEKLLLLI